jgi:hypothetical protein
MMDQNASKYVMAVVQLLANSADHSRLTPTQVDVLNQSVNELCKYDADEFVRRLLATLRDAHDVLTSDTAKRLAGYP